MNIQRGSDESEPNNPQQRKQQQAEDATKASSDVATELTIRLGEDFLPLPYRTESPSSKRQPEVTNVPTTLLGTSASQPESPPKKAGPSPDTARPLLSFSVREDPTRALVNSTNFFGSIR